MLDQLKAFWEDEEGLGTVEIVLIIVVLISLALIFQTKIKSFVSGIFGEIDGSADKFKISE